MEFAICAPSHNFVGLYLRNQGTYRQSEKHLLNCNISAICPHNMVNFGLLAAEIVSLVWGTQLIMVALWNRADHYIFILRFLLLLSTYLLFFLA